MARFDLDGSGKRTPVAWLTGNTSFLVLDRNGNGLIDSGRELFGGAMILKCGRPARHGSEALRDLDSNEDGVIDGDDMLFSKLRLWFDQDGSGTSEPWELTPLETMGIQRLSLAYQTVTEPPLGANGATEFRYMSRVQGSPYCGTLGCPMYDVYLLKEIPIGDGFDRIDLGIDGGHIPHDEAKAICEV